MASAKRETRDIEKTVVEKQDVIVLELTPDEAAAIRVLAGGVSGGGELRELADSVWAAVKADRSLDETYKRLYKTVTQPLSTITRPRPMRPGENPFGLYR